MRQWAILSALWVVSATGAVGQQFPTSENALNYQACLTVQAQDLDDHISDARTVASAASIACVEQRTKEIGERLSVSPENARKMALEQRSDDTDRALIKRARARLFPHNDR
jgi:hypothetical protein